jgi:hypothetical protein
VTLWRGAVEVKGATIEMGRRTRILMSSDGDDDNGESGEMMMGGP